MSHSKSTLLGVMVLLLTISICRAEHQCGDTEILKSYANTVKCQIVCDGSVIIGTAKDLTRMSDAELRQRTLRAALDRSSPDWKAQPYYVKVLNFIASVKSSSLIAWRDAFRTMKVSVAGLDYDHSSRKHTCQASISFDRSLLSEAIRRHSQQLALTDSKTMRLVLYKIAEDRDPAPLLAEMAKLAEEKVAKCLSTNGIFYLQSTSETNFTLDLGRNPMSVCRRF